jgi:RND superfamily putative drug exporter
VREIIAGIEPPAGVQAYVTGPAASTSDQRAVGDASMRTIEALTFVVIITMLLLVYRSVVTVVITMGMVVIGLLSARGSSRSWVITRSSGSRHSPPTCW